MLQGCPLNSLRIMIHNNNNTLTSQTTSNIYRALTVVPFQRDNATPQIPPFLSSLQTIPSIHSYRTGGGSQ
jgi:hypothetical protein